MIDLLNYVAPGASGLVLFIIIYVQRENKLMKARLFTKLDSIHQEVHHTNGRVMKLETWRLGHEENHARQYQEYRDDQVELKTLIREIRSS